MNENCWAKTMEFNQNCLIVLQCSERFGKCADLTLHLTEHKM